MKRLICAALIAAFASTAMADETNGLPSVCTESHWSFERLWDGQLSAQDFVDRAQRRIVAGEKDQGLCDLLRAVQAEHPLAPLMLAREYFARGDNDAGQRHLASALDAGDLDAMQVLAELYEQGNGGLPRNHRQAFSLYYNLAKVGRATAMHAIGYYFVRGLHGVKDDVAAAYWYHRAAMLGHTDAQRAYAYMLQEGIGGEVNPDEARYWSRRAGDEHHGI